MDTALSCLKDEIAYRKQEAIGILRHRYTDEQIHDFCIRFYKTPESADLLQELTSEKYPPETFFAIAALASLMYLEGNIPPASNYSLPAEYAADLILTGFNAMLSLTEAGWKPAEPHALVRLKMLKNQPITRVRDNTPTEDISEELDSYNTQKGHPPRTFDDFLTWLECSGCDIDRAEQTIDSREWKKCRKIGTIKNWWRDHKNQIPLK